MSEALQAAVARQRMLLQSRLSSSLSRLVAPCLGAWGDRRLLEGLLQEAMGNLPSCKYLYLLDHKGHQVTANITRDGLLPDQLGRDRSGRPYMAEAMGGAAFSLSSAYISRNRRRPSLTAVQRVTAADGGLLGFLGADFDLRELPLTRELYQQPHKWVQMRGDPAIRGGLFQQQRVESLMDTRIDEVLDLVTELVAAHGVFHAKLHFSSSRATLWLMDDPYRFRILDIEDLTDPAICLAYPQRPYPDGAAIPLEQVQRVFHTFRELRFVDENIYLRAGSLNIFNGIVGLNFSCDGTHYMGWEDFLGRRLEFWLGTGASCVVESLEDAAAPSAGDFPGQ